MLSRANKSIKYFIIGIFLLVGLTYSVATIFNISGTYYYDIAVILTIFSLATLNTILILGLRIESVYKYLSIASLLFIFWNTIFYFVFYYFDQVNVLFYVLQITSLFIFLTYGIWKARVYDAQRERNKKHPK